MSIKSRSFNYYWFQRPLNKTEIINKIETFLNRDLSVLLKFCFPLKRTYSQERDHINRRPLAEFTLRILEFGQIQSQSGSQDESQLQKV